MVQTTTNPPGSANTPHHHIAARIDRIPPVRFHYKLAGTLSFGTYFDGFDAISIAVVLPLVVASFGLGFSEAGLIISAGYLGQWVGALVIGALSDRIGRRPAFIMSLALFGAMSLGCALAWSETSLLVLRLIQGIGLGAEVPIAATLLNEYLGRRARGRGAILYQSAFSWGLFSAPLAALILIEQFGPEAGWRLLLVLGALPLLVAVWAWFTLPESARWLAANGQQERAERIVESMEQQALSAHGTLEEPEPTPQPRHSRTRFGELFSREYRGRMTVLAIAWFMTFFVSYGYFTWLPTMYVTVGGLPQSASLALTVVLGAFQLVVIYVTAWLVDRSGRRPLLLAGFAISLTGSLFGAVMVGSAGITGWPVLFSVGVLLTAGMSIPANVLYLYTSELFPLRMRGWATATCSSFNRAASIFSPFLFGFMLGERGGGPGLVFVSLGIAAAIALTVIALGGVETRGRSLEELAR